MKCFEQGNTEVIPGRCNLHVDISRLGCIEDQDPACGKLAHYGNGDITLICMPEIVINSHTHTQNIQNSGKVIKREK